MTSPASHRRHRRVRRLKRRGRLTPAEAQALSMRSRDEWPITKSITRWHRSKWNVKPREKWLDRREVSNFIHPRGRTLVDRDEIW